MVFYSLRPHPVSIRWVNPPVDAAGYAHVRHCLVCAAKRQKEGADTTANESENVGEEREKRKEGREGREGKGRKACELISRAAFRSHRRHLTGVTPPTSAVSTAFAFSILYSDGSVRRRRYTATPLPPFPLPFHRFIVCTGTSVDFCILQFVCKCESCLWCVCVFFFFSLSLFLSSSSFSLFLLLGLFFFGFVDSPLRRPSLLLPSPHCTV